MTTLTKIVPDLRDRAVRADFSSAGHLHRRLIRLLPSMGDSPVPDPRRRAGLLFRVEEDRAGLHLLVQSADPLDTTALGRGYGSVQSRDLDPLLERLEKGAAVRYRIVASPVKRLGKSAQNARRLGIDEDTPARAYTRPLRGAEADEWWISRADANGLSLNTATAHALDDARDRGVNRDRRIRHPAVRFDGTAAVSDVDAVRTAVRNGIGRGRSHGCGLLSLAFVGR